MSEPSTAPPRVRLHDPLGTFGKAVGAVAGAGVFLYLIGVAVLWESLAGAGLPTREVIAVIPRDQVAVLGARETLQSALAGALFALYLYAFYRIFRVSERTKVASGVRGRLANSWRTNPAAPITLMVAISCVLFGPADARDGGLLALFLINLYLGMRSAHRSLIGELPDFRTSLRPWLRVALGLSIAILIASLARQSQFPEQFPVACIYSKGDNALPCNFDVDAGGPTRDRFLYLGSTADSVVLGRPPDINKGPRCTPMGPNPSTGVLLVTRSSIDHIELLEGPGPCPPARSLLRRLHIHLDIDCIAPICQLGDKRRSFLSPFVTGS